MYGYDWLRQRMMHTDSSGQSDESVVSGEGGSGAGIVFMVQIAMYRPTTHLLLLLIRQTYFDEFSEPDDQ